ncbi:hypothetical protein R6Q59_035816 [Mikania micrantha]
MFFIDATKPYRINLFQNQFNGSNFFTWMHHLRRVLRIEGKLYALDNPITPKSPIGCTTSERMKHIGHECEIKYLILTLVSPGYVDQLMYLSSHEIIKEIKKSFLPNRFWQFEILNEVQKGLRPGGDVGAHVDRLQGYFDRLGKLYCY